MLVYVKGLRFLFPEIRPPGGFRTRKEHLTGLLVEPVPC
jgi:hypothetical protein